MPSIQAVAFAFMSPDALWVILKYKGYKILVAGDRGEVTPPAGVKNLLVMVPDFKQIRALAPVADQIHRVLVLAKGQHAAVVKQGIPLLDATVQPDGSLAHGEIKTAEQYKQEIEKLAVEVDLAPLAKAPLPLPTPKKTKVPDTLVGYVVDYVDSLVPADFPLATLVTKPAVLFCLGNLTKPEYKASLKAAVQAGLDNQAAKNLYRWVQQYSVIIADAAHVAVTKAEPTGKIAMRYAVPQEDLDLIVSVYR